MSNPIHRRSVDRFMAMADGREEVSVLASEYDALESENEALRSQLTDAQVAYVARGMELRDAEARLADIESQNRVMWDVANDREARLAEAERNEETLLGMIRHQRDVLRECLPYLNESMAGRRPGRSADYIRAAVNALTADAALERRP